MGRGAGARIVVRPPRTRRVSIAPHRRASTAAGWRLPGHGPGRIETALLECKSRFYLSMSELSPSEHGPIAAAEQGAAADRTGPAAAGTPAPLARSAAVSRALLGATLAVAVLVSAVVWLDGRRTQQLLRAEVAQRLARIETAAESADKAEAQLAAELRDVHAKLGLLEARVAESQEQQASLEALYRDLSPSRDEIVLNEIEQVLLVAGQQLQLAGNVPGALAALELADARLQRLERPQFLPLRRALARDIDRLKAVPYVDVSGLSLKLDQLATGVDALPLAMDERLPRAAPEPPTPVERPPWQRFMQELWAELRDLVRIEVADRPAAPLVPPTQQYFLRENLKLRLLSARIALLDHDDAAFKADVAAADAWLRQYFDTRSKPVQADLATLKQLAATAMPRDLPDLARTLDAARVLRLATERTAPGRAGGR